MENEKVNIPEMEQRIPRFQVEQINAMAGDQIQELWNRTEAFLAEINTATRQQIAIAERERAKLKQLQNMAEHTRSVIRWCKSALKNI